MYILISYNVLRKTLPSTAWRVVDQWCASISFKPSAIASAPFTAFSDPLRTRMEMDTRRSWQWRWRFLGSTSFLKIHHVERMRQQNVILWYSMWSLKRSESNRIYSRTITGNKEPTQSLKTSTRRCKIGPTDQLTTTWKLPMWLNRLDHVKHLLKMANDGRIV